MTVNYVISLIVFICCIKFFEAWNPFGSLKRFSVSLFNRDATVNPKHFEGYRLSVIEDDGYSISHTRNPVKKWWRNNIGAVQPGILIMIRHGETNLNYNKTFTGWIDTDLSGKICSS
jgi:hypothetical protein